MRRVLIVSQGDAEQLTRFNTWNRRVFLCCKLLAPLIVSTLTTATSTSKGSGGYRLTAVVLLSVSLVTCATELVWIGVVWRAFPVLHSSVDEQTPKSSEESAGSAWDLLEFARLPVFLSSLAVSTLYLTTLSFDGIMLSWLKSERGWSDVTIAWMRGVCVVTGLAGTVVMPKLEKVVGLARAGAWSIW